MYIQQYWGNYIGDTDDSLTLLAYLSGKERTELDAKEIFSDFGLDFRNDLRQTVPPLVYEDPEGWEMDIHFAADLVMDLAALLLECRENGRVSLTELGEETDLPNGSLRITAGEEELEGIGAALADFAASPAAWDLSEFMPEEELPELAAILEDLRKDLCG